MGEAGRDFDDAVVLPAYSVFEDFAPVDLAEADQSLARDDHELLGLGVVIVVAAGDTRFGAGDEDLAEVGGFDEFGQVAAVIGFDLGSVLPTLGREVGEVGGVELAIEGDAEVGDLERVLHLAEELDPPGQIAEGDGVGGDGVGVDEDGGALGPIFHFADEGVDDVVDVDEFQLAFGIGNLNRQVVGDIVAEGGDDGVVVGATPFAEDVLESEDGDRCAGFGGETLEDLFGVAFAAAVGVVEGSLDGRAEDDVGVAARLADSVDEGLGEVGVAGFEIVRGPGAVDAGEVEDGVAVCHPPAQWQVDPIQIVGLNSSFLPGPQMDGEVLSQESAGAGNQDFSHRFTHRACVDQFMKPRPFIPLGWGSLKPRRVKVPTERDTFHLVAGSGS